VGHELDGVRSLFHAVLLNAIKELRSGRSALRQDALYWFEDPQRHHVFSFIPLCEVLGFDPDTVRNKILRRK
jgi:hypothetical protein